MNASAPALLAALAACSNGPPEPMFPDISYPKSLTVTEGGSTTFQLWLEFPPSSPTGGQLLTIDPTVAAVMPGGFQMSPTNYPALMTVYGIDDMKSAGNRTTSFYGIVGDNTETSGGRIEVVDKSSQNVLASNWYVILAPSTTTAFDVQLTQAPPSATTVTIVVGNSPFGFTPTTMVFTPTDYNVPQQVTVTSSSATNVSSLIQLSPTNGIESQYIVVSATE